MKIYKDKIDGIELRIASTYGEREGIPLLIFNGIGASLEILEGIMDEMPVPCIAFDMPGVGESPLRFLGGRMKGYAKIGLSLIDSLDIEIVDVMGVSWGGGVAQEFTKRHGLRTRKLILAATSMGQVMIPPSPLVLMLMASPVRHMSSSYFKLIAPLIYGGDFRNNPALVNKHAGRMASPSILGYLQQLVAIGGWTSVFWLHKIKQQTLVMAGTEDPVIPLINARIITKRLPNARLETFDCGHLFILTRKEETIASMKAFLAT
ncbi:MAG: poly(3-hydroxyalkanoate) depolymerase [Candidatus Azotimanducaceae bacterium]|jgi:poly(3-hydroxyalkanoate) depolymerase